ncbi:MAG: FlgD immunoglobulin-like domain containing protein [bacterium]
MQYSLEFKQVVKTCNRIKRNHKQFPDILTIVALYLILFTTQNMSLQCKDIEADSIKSKKTILEKNEFDKFAPLEYFTKDTIFNKPLYDDDYDRVGLQHGYITSPIQDSSYQKAKKLKIPVSVRLQNDLKRFEGKRSIIKDMESGLPWQIALENLNIRPEILSPTSFEIVQRQEMINNAFYIPFMPNRINSGFSISPQELGVFLGILEDVSPVISFELDYTEEIEVVVYSIQAVVVATLFKGIRHPGKQTFVWNGRDDKGRPLPSGDYIGEVRIGNNRFIRKRIQLQ